MALVCAEVVTMMLNFADIAQCGCGVFCRLRLLHATAAIIILFGQWISGRFNTSYVIDLLNSGI